MFWLHVVFAISDGGDGWLDSVVTCRRVVVEFEDGFSGKSVNIVLHFFNKYGVVCASSGSATILTVVKKFVGFSSS